MLRYRKRAIDGKSAQKVEKMARAERDGQYVLCVAIAIIMREIARASDYSTRRNPAASFVPESVEMIIESTT